VTPCAVFMIETGKLYNGMIEKGLYRYLETPFILTMMVNMA
jgi:hypothetical protein